MICSVDGCKRDARARGFCGTHYARARRNGDPTITVAPTPTDSPTERLARNLTAGEPDECWEWRGHRDRDGYGSVRYRGRRYKAHAFSLMVATGVVIEPGVVVRHRCDNPPCCNPSHLELGSTADNAADRSMRGRSARHIGAANPMSKLTPNAVLAIRERAAAGCSFASLGREFGVSRKAISKVLNGLTWKEVTT